MDSASLSWVQTANFVYQAQGNVLSHVVWDEVFFYLLFVMMTFVAFSECEVA